MPTTSALPDPDEWRRLTRGIYSNQPWRDAMRASQMPARSIREFLKATQVPSQSLREMLGASVAKDMARLRAEADATLVASRQLSGADLGSLRRQMLDVPRVSSLADLMRQAKPSAGVRELMESLPTARDSMRQMVEASRPPRTEWREALHALRGVAEGASDTLDKVQAQVDEAADEPDSATPPVSWLLRLSLPKQLALLVAVLEALDQVGRFMTDLAGGDDLPPEVRSGTQALFAVVAVLLMVIELRMRPPED